MSYLIRNDQMDEIRSVYTVIANIQPLVDINLHNQMCILCKHPSTIIDSGTTSKAHQPYCITNTVRSSIEELKGMRALPQSVNQESD